MPKSIFVFTVMFKVAYDLMTTEVKKWHKYVNHLRLSFFSAFSKPDQFAILKAVQSAPGFPADSSDVSTAAMFEYVRTKYITNTDTFKDAYHAYGSRPLPVPLSKREAQDVSDDFEHRLATFRNRYQWAVPAGQDFNTILYGLLVSRVSLTDPALQYQTELVREVLSSGKKKRTLIVTL